MIYLLVLLLATVVASVIVRGPVGPHQVTYSVKALTDTRRWGSSIPLAKPHKRRILISIFSPLNKNADCHLAQPLSYLPPATATTYGGVLESLGLPNYLLDGFELQFCQPLSHEPKSDIDYPVVIFSPGFGNSRLLSSAQAQSLASHGYTVITVDHPYEATIVEFPSGEVVYGYNLTDFNNDLAEKFVKIRAADISFLNDQLPSLLGFSRNRKPKVFVYGHSLGGATAALAALLDSRVIGGLDLDGSIYGSVKESGLNKPFVLVGRPVPVDLPIGELFDGLYDRLRREKMLVIVNDTQHLSFCDAPFLVTLRADIPDEYKPVVEAVLGSVDGQELAGTLDELLVSTAQLVFGGDAKGLCDIATTNKGLLVLDKELTCAI